MRLSFVLLTIAGFGLPQATFSSSHQQVPPPASATGQLAVPANDAAATLPMEDGFGISIHRASPGGNTAGTYFHQPAFAVIAAPKPEKGWSAHVRDVENQDGGVEFRVHVRGSSEEIRRLARDIVLSPAPVGDEVGLENISPTSVEVQRWPVNEVQLAIYARAGAESAIAVGTLQLSGEEKQSGIWKIPMSAQSKDVERLKSALKSGSARFSYAYKYRGDNVAFGRASQTFLIEAKRAVDTGLAAVQKKDNGPIFQKERREIATLVEETTQQVMVANDISMVQLLSVNWDNTLFREATSVKNFGQPLPPDLLADVESYLERMVDELGTEIVEEESTTTENSTTTKMTLKADGGWSSNAGWKLSAGGKVDKTWQNSAKNEWGVTTTIDEDRNVAVATDIDVSFLSDDYLSGVRRASTYAFLATPAAQGFRDAEIAEASRLIPEDERVVATAPYVPDVPVGGAFCYFGTTTRPPEGYAFLDEANAWPDSPIFAGLGGTSMPSMENMLMGGATDPNSVGTTWTDGWISIDAATVNGSSFSVAGQPMVGFMREQTSHDRTGHVWSSEYLFNRGTGPLMINSAINQYWETSPHQTRVFGPDRIKFVILDYMEQTSSNPDDPYAVVKNALMRPRYFTTPDKIEGSATIPKRTISLGGANAMPNHVKCRWIVRTR